MTSCLMSSMMPEDEEDMMPEVFSEWAANGGVNGAGASFFSSAAAGVGAPVLEAWFLR